LAVHLRQNLHIIKTFSQLTVKHVEISLHFNFAFVSCSTGIYRAFAGQAEFLWVCNLAILSYLQNSPKFHPRENNVAYSINAVWLF